MAVQNILVCVDGGATRTLEDLRVWACVQERVRGSPRLSLSEYTLVFQLVMGPVHAIRARKTEDKRQGDHGSEVEHLGST